MIISNAKIYRSKKASFENLDLRIKNKHIVEMKPWGSLMPSPAETVLNYSGHYLYPGFIDSHCHLIGTGEKYLVPSLCNCCSKEELASTIQKLVPHKSILVLRGWDENKLDFYPDRQFLDSLPIQKPILLIRNCGHIATVNSSAIKNLSLESLNGSDETILEKGILKERAVLVSKQKIPQDVLFEQRCLSEGMHRFNQVGVTSVQSEDWNPDRCIRFFGKIDKLPTGLRLFEKISIQHPHEIDNWIQRNNIHLSNEASPFYNLTTIIKLYMDGSICGKTASISVPYLYSTNCKEQGVSYYAVEEMKSFFAKADQSNLQICIHIIGDRSLEQVLQSIPPGKNIHRHRIIHAQFASQNQIHLMKEKNIELSIQPCFYKSDLPIITKILPASFIDCCGYPFQQYALAGIPYSLSTDSPVESENPFANLSASFDFFSRKEAFNAYTVSGARQVFRENDLGQIETGFLADFFLLKENIFSISKTSLNNVKPVCVFVDGKQV